MTNLEQSGSWIPDAWSVKLKFSLIVTFYLTKTEDRSEQSNAALKLLLSVKVLFCQKMLLKNAGISKIEEVLVLKAIFSKTTYVGTCVPNFKFLAILTSFRQGLVLPPPPTATGTPKKTNQIKSYNATFS